MLCTHDTDFVTCDIWPVRKLFNLGGTRIGSLVRYLFFSADKLSTDKYAVTILDIVFGCYTAGSHHWTLEQLSIDIGHRKKNNN